MKNSKGLTLIEILITVLIIGMVAAIAIPAVTQFGEDTREKVCRQNLRTIDNTKLQWAIDKNESDDVEPTEEDLADYIRGDFPQAVVAGALYKIGSVITPALCSYHGNSFIEGFGMTFSPGITELVKSGKLSASDVVDGDWVWFELDTTRGWFIKYPEHRHRNTHVRDGTRYELFSYGNDEEFYTDGPVEVRIDDKVIRGDLRHFSKEHLELNRAYHEMRRDTDEYPFARFLTRMTEGGYMLDKVSNKNRYHIYYDHQGKILGYEESVNPWKGPSEEEKMGIKGDCSVHNYYDGNGTLIQKRVRPKNSRYYYDYDSNGNLIRKRVYPRGKSYYCDYDAGGNLIKVTYTE